MEPPAEPPPLPLPPPPAPPPEPKGLPRSVKFSVVAVDVDTVGIIAREGVGQNPNPAVSTSASHTKTLFTMHRFS